MICCFWLWQFRNPDRVDRSITWQLSVEIIIFKRQKWWYLLTVRIWLKVLECMSRLIWTNNPCDLKNFQAWNIVKILSSQFSEDSNQVCYGLLFVFNISCLIIALLSCYLWRTLGLKERIYEANLKSWIKVQLQLLTKK